MNTQKSPNIQKVSYGMTKDYRSSWSIVDAIRELVQNCVDNQYHESDYQIEDAEDGMSKITISTHGFDLPVKTLAMGVSEKPDGAIGGFGEGMKLAMMILSREGCDIIMETSTFWAKPDFNHDDFLGEETFSINIFMHEGDQGFDGLRFYFLVPTNLVDEIKFKITPMSDEPIEAPDYGTVSFIKDRPGMIYVGGLFVCHNPKFKYGYNFCPTILEIGCDRQVASNNGMSWETSRAWAERVDSDTAHEVISMITSDYLDASDIQYHITKSRAKVITEAFVERFGHVTIKPMGSTLSYGMGLCGPLYQTVSMSGYSKVAKPYMEDGKPYRVIEGFYNDHSETIDRLVSKRFKGEFMDIMEKSKNWVDK